MDENTLTRIIQGLLGLIMAIGAWLWARAIRDIDNLEEHMQRSDLDHADFKTHVANTYSKEASTQASLSRIHDRIDKLPGEIVALIDRKK